MTRLYNERDLPPDAWDGADPLADRLVVTQYRDPITSESRTVTPPLPDDTQRHRLPADHHRGERMSTCQEPMWDDDHTYCPKCSPNARHEPDCNGLDCNCNTAWARARRNTTSPTGESA